jgi:hypothetical protein
MKSLLSKKVANKVRFIAYYQIVGGIVGLGLAAWLSSKTTQFPVSVVIIYLLVIGFYYFSIYCGILLLKQDLKKGLKLSLINQLLQVFNFSVLGYSFKYISGVLLIIGLDFTNETKSSIRFSLGSEFQFNLNGGGNEELTNLGFNLVAIFLVYFIDRLQHKIEEKEELEQELIEVSNSQILDDNF